MMIGRLFEKEIHCNAARGARHPLSAVGSRFTALRTARCSQERRGHEPQLRTGYVSRPPQAIHDSVDRERAMVVRVICSPPHLHMQLTTFREPGLGSVKLQGPNVSIAQPPKITSESPPLIPA